MKTLTVKFNKQRSQDADLEHSLCSTRHFIYHVYLVLFSVTSIIFIVSFLFLSNTH